MSRLARPALALVPALLLLAAAPPGRAQVLGRLETPDLRLVYTKGGESFLVPHAGRTSENSMGFQRRMFDYRPSQKVTVLLTDFADSGNAGAAAVPRNFLGIQIAPLSFAFETIPANERMNTIMNHELVHVVTMDQAAGTDRFFRTAFSGKVMPIAAQPESILYFYLTTPRVATPRWYLEGSAVFFDTWMAGGIGRAQSPWDEMVFRSMVRDGSRFYDPLGLVSEGVKVDFQVQVQSYLYGGRFMSYLALAHSPEHVARWVERKDGSKAYYASQFREVFGVSLEQAWRDWVAWERGFQQKNLETIREHPTTPARDIGTRALGSVSRTHRSRDGRLLYAAFNYPGTVAHVGALSRCLRHGEAAHSRSRNRGAAVGIHFERAAAANARQGASHPECSSLRRPGLRETLRSPGRSGRRTSRRSGSTRRRRSPTCPGARWGRSRAPGPIPRRTACTPPSTTRASWPTSGRSRSTTVRSRGSSTSRGPRCTP